MCVFHSFTLDGSKNLERFSKKLQIPKSPSMESLMSEILNVDRVKDVTLQKKLASRPNQPPRAHLIEDETCAE